MTEQISYKKITMPDQDGNVTDHIEVTETIIRKRYLKVSEIVAKKAELDMMLGIK